MISKVYNYINNSNYIITIEKNIIYIANYIKIIDISYNEIKIQLVNNYLTIRGNNLTITKLNTEELNICGVIKGLDIVEK